MSARPVRAFPWGPVQFRRYTIAITIGIHAYLYLGMVVLAYVVNDQRWILGWKPLAITLVSAALFSRLSYRWIMRLDAQYGRGSGWALVSRAVKLPELVDRARR
jgi:hypothetical protein